MRSRHLTAVAVLLGLAAAACANDDPASSGDSTQRSGRLTVAVAFFPVEEVVRMVGGESVEIVTIVPPGEEAHEYEPTAKELTGLSDADVVVYLGGDFQPNVEKAIESLPSSVQRVDLLDAVETIPFAEADHGDEEEGHGDEEEGHEGDDPHVWLDPTNMARMAAAVADTFATARPDQAAAFTAAAEAYGAELNALDEEMAAGLASCETDALVTNHDAFGYLTAAYNLRAVSIAGISPGEEPSAQALEAVAEIARENDVTTIFFEENLPDDLARTVADEIGGSIAVLNPIESLSQAQLDAGDTYISVMRSNLEALRAGLRCA